MFEVEWSVKRERERNVLLPDAAGPSMATWNGRAPFRSTKVDDEMFRVMRRVAMFLLAMILICIVFFPWLLVALSEFEGCQKKKKRSRKRTKSGRACDSFCGCRKLAPPIIIFYLIRSPLREAQKVWCRKATSKTFRALICWWWLSACWRVLRPSGFMVYPFRVTNGRWEACSGLARQDAVVGCIKAVDKRARWFPIRAMMSGIINEGRMRSDGCERVVVDMCFAIYARSNCLFSAREGVELNKGKEPCRSSNNSNWVPC